VNERDTWFWLFFRLSGRIDRTVYMLSFLFLVAVVTLPFYQLMRAIEAGQTASTWELVFSIAFLATFWSSIAISVKRLHDLGKPGIFAVALVIPMVSLITFFLLALWPGNPGANQFGRRPNAPG
jgi:uncharacterized membrane protein YhaH (DUF805 family)